MNDRRAWRNNKALHLALAGLAALAISGLVLRTVGGAASHVLFYASQIVVVTLVIWQACDPFSEAAQWIGNRFRVPGSVRGATLDAVASSMPELFSSLLFVVVAVVNVDQAQRMQAGSDGFGAAVATCAGSAVYNMILIPAACALVISFVRKSRPTIDVAPQVILRDGMWFISCEFVLILFLFQPTVHWWMAVVLFGLYVVYVFWLYNDARRFQQAMKAAHARVGSAMDEITTENVARALAAAGIPAGRALVREVRNRLIDEAVGERCDDRDDEKDEKVPQATEVLFGLFDVKLNMTTVWIVIAVSTAVAAVACYWLVELTRTAAEGLGVPIFFIAVILAAAVSSVPDTFLSIGAARRGDDDGAVSNAFGSNIFDICVCLALPLLVASYLNGWQPISLTQDGKPLAGLVGIRILLCVLTLVSLLVMWHNQQLTRRKALVLCGLYAVFVAYAVGGSLGLAF